jgi:Spy/CpxP family protein refolding chaperone
MTRRIILLTALAVAAWGQMGPGGPPPIEELKTYLGLTDTQIQALQQLRRQEMEALQPVHQQMQEKQRTLREQIQAGSTDAAGLGRLLLEIEALRKSVGEIHKKFHEQAVNSLSADQKTKLNALAEAGKLQPTIGQATALGLLEPPQGPGAGPGFGMGFGPRGPGRGPGPAAGPRFRR